MHFKALSCCCPELTQGIGKLALWMLFYLFYATNPAWASLEPELYNRQNHGHAKNVIVLQTQ